MNILGGLACFAIGIGTLSGHVQQVIPFAGIENEIGFAVLAFMMSFLCTGMGISNTKEKSNV